MAASEMPRVFTLPVALQNAGFALRPETEDDIPFLLALFATTRADELALVDWSEEQKRVFIASQFRAQRHHYRTYMPDCAYDVIEHEGAPAGRLYLDVRPARLHIVDITLMPDRRGQGHGTAFLQALQEKAAESGRALGIMVEKFNPAQRLYRRLGFSEVADHDVYFEMEWRPDGAQLNVA